MPTIIVPVHHKPKECVVVDGKVYCKQEDMTSAQAGAGILALVLFCAWVIAGFEWGSKHGWGWLGNSLYFAGPLVVLAFVLLGAS